MIRTDQKDNKNHMIGVNPLIVTFNAAVIMPIKKKMRTGISRIP
jgi:hypothetical protein